MAGINATPPQCYLYIGSFGVVASPAYDAVCFDLDGVIIDSTEVTARHWRRWAEAKNLDPLSILRLAPGRRTEETIRMVAPHLDVADEAARLAAEEAPDTTGLRILDGVTETLSALQTARWAVVTSGTGQTASIRLACFDLPLPPVLVTAEDVERGKPDPQGYLLAACRLGVEAGSCLVVEDSPAGVRAAKAAGMTCLALLTTHRALDLVGADWLVASLGAVELTPDPQGRITLRIRRS